jgi:hypothetical protein
MTGFLDQLELRTHRALWSDGLLDLFCGLAVLAIGVAWVVEQHVFGAIVPALLVPLWKPVRQRFTEPRLGSVELGEPRQQRNRGFIRMLVVAGVLSFVAGVGAFLLTARGMDPALGLVKAFPGTLVGIAAIACAEALQLRRFFLYGFLTIAAAVVTALVEPLNPGWAFVVGGATALLGAVLLMTHFTREHPRPPEGA